MKSPMKKEIILFPLLSSVRLFQKPYLHPLPQTLHNHTALNPESILFVLLMFCHPLSVLIQSRGRDICLLDLNRLKINQIRPA